MCRAMNRSITNVLFGGFGAVAADATGAGGTMREINLEDAAVQLAYANRVIFIPGYGLATAQAQHAVRELGDLLEGRGVTVKYAIHPVAGRMPGHMNVLLAEANIPYSSLYEMEQINPEFPSTDVAVVIGANDVVNPDARDNPKSPIAGMPILEVDRAKSVIVLKRGQGRGFSGLENPLVLQAGDDDALRRCQVFADATDAGGSASLSKCLGCASQRRLVVRHGVGPRFRAGCANLGISTSAQSPQRAEPRWGPHGTWGTVATNRSDPHSAIRLWILPCAGLRWP